MAAKGTIRPALIIVDMQEDFCPPNGSLAVQDGRSIAPTINHLLSKPFITRIFTKDYHPKNHISFATNHPPPNNLPFTSTIPVNNPARGKESETKPQQLWPEHCVAESPGAEIIPEMNTTLADLIVHKGMRAEVEMYSVFADSFGNCDPGTNCHSVSLDVAARLRDESITDVFVVGLAGDYCVKETAVDAIKAGFRSWVIEEGTKCVMPDSWKGVEDELKKAGVAVVSVHDPVIEGL